MSHRDELVQKLQKIDPMRIKEVFVEINDTPLETVTKDSFRDSAFRDSFKDKKFQREIDKIFDAPRPISEVQGKENR